MTNLEHNTAATHETELNHSPASEAVDPPIEMSVKPSEIALHALAASSLEDRQRVEALHRLRAK